MPHFLTSGNVSGDLYVRSLASAYLPGKRLYDPGFALAQDPDIYDKIRRDTVVAHALEQRRHLIAGRDWHLEAGESDDASKRASALMEALLSKVSRFSSARFNLAESVVRGSSYAFVEGSRQSIKLSSDNRTRSWWVPFHLKDVDRRRFRQVVLTAQETGTGKPSVAWELFSAYKGSWFRLENPEWFVKHIYEDNESSLGYGRGLLEAIYYYYYAKATVLREGLQAVERWAQGLLHAKIDTTRGSTIALSNETLVQDWLDALDRMRSRHVIVHDKADDIEVVQGPGQGWQLVLDFLGYLDTGLRVLILGSNLPSSSTEGGSFALAKVQENSTEALLQFDRRLLEETLDRDLVGLVWNLNKSNLTELGIGEAKRPHFKINQEKIEDPVQAAQVAVQALSAGIPLRKDEVYDKLGYSVPTEQDEVIEPRLMPITPGLPPLQAATNGSTQISH